MSVTVAGGTKIEWCDYSFNPWQGCEKVSPACAHCYAEKQAARFTKGLWGAGHGFRFASEAYWRRPLAWARTAPDKLGRRPRVFCASMADVFEERDELEPVRHRLFALIADTPELDWLLLTKRPEFANEWLRDYYERIMGIEIGPVGARVARSKFFNGLENVWVGVSIENARFTWRADVLRQIPAAVRFISAEPLLGSLITDRVKSPTGPVAPSDRGTDGLEEGSAASGALRRAPLDLTGIDWLIIGGESGPSARSTDLRWIRELLAACTNAGVQPFVKQLGRIPIYSAPYIVGTPAAYTCSAVALDDPKGGDWDEWPADLRIREFPRSAA